MRVENVSSEGVVEIIFNKNVKSDGSLFLISLVPLNLWAQKKIMKI
jgi:hypothetical protein